MICGYQQGYKDGFKEGEKAEFERIIDILNKAKCGCTIQYLKNKKEN